MLILSLITFAKVSAQVIPISAFCIYEEPLCDGILLSPLL